MVSSKATVAKALGKRTSVLDIGCGNAERLTQLAKKHPKRRFAGLEWKKQKGVQTRLNNLKIIWGDALSKLKRLPTSSTKIITSTFFLADIRSGDYTAQDLWDFGFEDLARELSKKRNEIIKQARRVLTPNGKLIIIEYTENIERAKAILTQSGFSCTEKPVTEEELTKTEYLRKLLDEKRKGGIPENKVPIKIIATKS